MTNAQINNLTEQKPLRVWPGVVAVLLQWLAWIVLPIVAPEAALYGILGGVLGGGLVVILWWLFFSRTAWRDRIGVLVLIIVALFATSFIVDKSIANGGMGMLLYLYAIPVLCLVLVGSAWASRRLAAGHRHLAIVAAILLACGGFAFIRTGGITGDGSSDFHWRWRQTPEERLLALPDTNPAAPPTIPPLDKTVADWPGFRGPDRNSIVRGVKIETDWSRSPPKELWHRPIGPGWSSFAVQGNLLYTQEQRGNDEVVACYSITTGQPVWSHRDAARFWESNAGAGPRATPTLSNGHVYTLGATGIVNALDAANGAVIWSQNAAVDTGAKIPDWGFAGSPLVIDNMVIVATAGRLVAYDHLTGAPRWKEQSGGGGYSSPHLATIGNVKQILLLNTAGAISVAPATGAQLWKYSWPGDGIVQPTMTTDGDILLGSGSGLSAGVGVRRISVAYGTEEWTTTERWTSTGLKPYFNDYIVHQGHAYGFDGSVLACISLMDGQRKWKGGRYGHGQLILISDQDLLLVQSEKGELALVAATPDQFKELARIPAIEGKTWNHPALVGDILLVRNDQEMAAFRLSLAGR